MTSTTRTLAHESEKPTVLARIRARFGMFDNPLAPRSDFAQHLLAEGIFPLTREVAMGPKDGEAPKKLPSFELFQLALQQTVKFDTVYYAASRPDVCMMNNIDTWTGQGYRLK